MDAMRLDLAPMTADAFLRWNEGREPKHELVDGVPVMMTGTTRAHNAVAVNVVLSLAPQVRSRGCDVSTSDFATRTGDYQVRYPDVVVDCGAGEPGDLAATEPVLVVEIASPSTREFDAVGKLAEYQSVPSIRYVLLVKPDVVDVASYERGEAGWSLTRFRGLDDVVPLAGLDASLPLAALYEGLSPVVLPPLRPVG